MMYTEQPLVSIIIPTYKRSVEMLSRAIESAFSQSYKNIEVVVVDDNGREDIKEFRENNRKFLDNLKKERSNLLVIYNEKNIGGALSRNEGIKAASGEYITFLDDDDLFLKDKVLHQINFMLENNFNVSFTDLTLYNEKEQIVDRRVRNDIEKFDKATLIKYHLTKTISSTETFMVHKDILNQIGGFDDAVMGHEFYLMFKILMCPDTRIGYFKSDDIKAYRTSLECISNGPNKIKGENALYSFRKSKFSYLNKKEQNYVKCRHRAVIANTYKRQRKYFKALGYLIAAFFTNPLTAFKEAFSFKSKRGH